MKLPAYAALTRSELAGVRTRWFNRAAQPEDPRESLRYWPRRMPSGVPVTIETAWQVSALWACIDAISKAIASQPWNVFQLLPNGDWDRRPYDQVESLLSYRPNPEISAINFRRAIMIALLSWGNAYAEIVWAGGYGRPMSLHLIHPERVTPERDMAGRLVYRVDNGRDGQAIIQAADMLHFSGPSINGLVGDNLITKAAHSIGLAISSERFAETSYGNSTTIGAQFQTDQVLGEEAFEQLKEEVDGRAGPDSAHRPMVLDSGLKYVPPSLPDMDKAQMVAMREHQIREICRWYGVPPHKVADLARATFSNIEHSSLEFVRDCLTPWAVTLQQEVDWKLLSSSQLRRCTRIDLEPLSQGDAKSRADYYQIMRNIGAYSVNDILRMEGKNTIGAEGDIRIVNGAAIRLEDVGTNYSAKPEAPKQLPDGVTQAARKPLQPITMELRDALCRALEAAYQAGADEYREYQARYGHLASIGQSQVYAAAMEPFDLSSHLAQCAGLIAHFFPGAPLDQAEAIGRRVCYGVQSADMAANEFINLLEAANG